MEKKKNIEEAKISAQNFFYKDKILNSNRKETKTDNLVFNCIEEN